MKREVWILILIVGAFALIQSFQFHGYTPPSSAEKPAQVSEENFLSLLEESPDWVLLEFWAPWCATCRRFKPVVQALAESRADQLRVLSVNVDDAPGVAGHFQVSAIPATVLLYQGMEKARFEGALPLDRLEKWVDGLLTP